ncbi:MAG TPA: very short patch repair endonuclease [Rubrivivax sp.]|nr:very short patch repair endonuclease [Rubrivivax sp.]
MADIMTPAERSRRMAGVRQSGTAPELALRKALHALGFRFRVNARHLPGRPDIVLPKFRVALFVHGCFWHGHCCPAGHPPATNHDYWLQKLAANRQRDRRKSAALRKLGWRAWVTWECELKTHPAAEHTARRLAARIRRIQAGTRIVQGR